MLQTEAVLFIAVALQIYMPCKQILFLKDFNWLSDAPKVLHMLKLYIH